MEPMSKQEMDELFETWEKDLDLYEKELDDVFGSLFSEKKEDSNHTDEEIEPEKAKTSNIPCNYPVESWLPEQGFETVLLWDRDEYKYGDVIFAVIEAHELPGYYIPNAMIVSDNYDGRMLERFKRGGSAEAVRIWVENTLKTAPDYVHSRRAENPGRLRKFFEE